MGRSVTLTWAECQAVVAAGGNRRLRRLRKGSQHRHGYDGADNWTAHIEAAGSEVAVAKLLGLYWFDDAEPDYAGDVGLGIQVRHTVRPNGRLILHKTDPDDHLFYLVRGEIPTFDVVGAINGFAGKVEEFWTDPGTGRPAYFVPDSKLTPPPSEEKTR